MSQGSELLRSERMLASKKISAIFRSTGYAEKKQLNCFELSSTSRFEGGFCPDRAVVRKKRKKHWFKKNLELRARETPCSSETMTSGRRLSFLLQYTCSGCEVSSLSCQSPVNRACQSCSRGMCIAPLEICMWTMISTMILTVSMIPFFYNKLFWSIKGQFYFLTP